MKIKSAIVLRLSIIAALILLYSSAFVWINYEYLNAPQRWLTQGVADTWNAKMSNLPKHQQNKVTLAELHAELNFLQRHFANVILDIPAKDIGFKGPYYGTYEPEDLVQIPSKVFDVSDTEEVYETEIQYYPQAAFDDFTVMVEQMKQDIGKEIWIDSGYRSPGKQAYLFFKYLADTEVGNNFSLNENAKWITMPGYSEHGSGKTPAFDFAIEGGDSMFLKSDGTKMSDEEHLDFLEQTQEYVWMVENAQNHNFYLSYPRDNDQGLSFEPWHWRWESKE